MRALVLIAIVVLGACVLTQRAHAQTWSSERARPALWQIIAVDPTGESPWLYGGEDIAKDGATAFAADEAAADLRTLYADADRSRFWLRAYLSSSEPARNELALLVFIDVDAHTDTGGPAQDALLWPQFASDPSAGGYERAIAVQGDGSVLGAFEWGVPQRRWTALEPRRNAIEVEVGRDRDPVRIGGTDHAYLQLSAEHAISGLDADCDGRVFVRSRLDRAAQPSFGDDALGATPCRPELDGLGDPVVLRAGSCAADSDCPAAGRCRDRVCLLSYECSADAYCKTGERCGSGACVLVVSGRCTDNADCAGLICQAGACVTCSESGSRSCAAGRVCTPRGNCVDPAGVGMAAAGAGGAPNAGSGGGRPAGAAGSAASEPAKLRGGAFHCAAGGGGRSRPLLGFWLAVAAWLWAARRGACGRARVR